MDEVCKEQNRARTALFALKRGCPKPFPVLTTETRLKRALVAHPERVESAFALLQNHEALNERKHDTA